MSHCFIYFEVFMSAIGLIYFALLTSLFAFIFFVKHIVFIKSIWENMLLRVRYQSFIENFNIRITLLYQVCRIRICIRDFLLKAFLLNCA